MLMANGQPADSAMTIKMSAAQEAVQTLVSDPVFSQAVVSISITTGNGEPLAAYNPNTMVVPASNMKLLSTGAAIHTLGSSHKFGTGIGNKGTI